MKGYWAIRLVGDPEFLARIYKEIKTESLYLLVLDQIYYLCSSKFTPDLDLEQMHKHAEETIKIMNGMALINPKLLPPKELSVGGVTRFDSDGQVSWTGAYSDLTISFVIGHSPHSEEEPANDPNKWLVLAGKDDLVSTVFRLFTYGVRDFVNSYRIYEIIMNDVGRDFALVGTSRSECDRFRGTANRPDTAGELSRHGFMAGDKMGAQPMSKEEIGQFIEKITLNWIHYKLKQS